MENLKTGNETRTWIGTDERGTASSGETAGGPVGSCFCRTVCDPGDPDVELPVYGELCQRTVHVFYPLYHYRSCLCRTEKISHNRGKNLLDADPPGDQSFHTAFTACLISARL